MNKYVYIILIVVGFLLGIVFHAKLLQQKVVIPACPSCNCPPAAKLELNNLQPNKIKGIKSFTYSPQISGNITVVVNDSSSLVKSIK